MTQGETQDATLRRAIAAATTAVADRRDVSVTFANDPPSLQGTRVQIPNPPRNPSAADLGQLRGAADSFAVRLRHHDPKVHAECSPLGAEARAAFDACEQARVEGLGARSMAGLAGNLDPWMTRELTQRSEEHTSELQSH